jgi:hypothetical protein
MFLNKVENLNEEKKFQTFRMFIDLKNKFRFIPLTDYDSLIKFVKNSILLSQKNISLSQKKFYCEKVDLKEQIFVKSKSKKKLSKINLQKEIEKLDKKINLNLFLEHIEYFKNFKGYIVLFECNASIERFEERENILGLAFFNQSLLYYDMVIFRLYNEADFETIKFILKLFFIEDKFLEIDDLFK